MKGVTIVQDFGDYAIIKTPPMPGCAKGDACCRVIVGIAKRLTPERILTLTDNDMNSVVRIGEDAFMLLVADRRVDDKDWWMQHHDGDRLWLTDLVRRNINEKVSFLTLQRALIKREAKRLIASLADAIEQDDKQVVTVVEKVYRHV